MPQPATASASRSSSTPTVRRPLRPSLAGAPLMLASGWLLAARPALLPSYTAGRSAARDGEVGQRAVEQQVDHEARHVAAARDRGDLGRILLRAQQPRGAGARAHLGQARGVEGVVI